MYIHTILYIIYTIENRTLLKHPEHVPGFEHHPKHVLRLSNVC